MNDDKEAMELVLARLNSMPENVQIHMGGAGEAFDKDKLIEHVKKRDKIGKRFVKLQLEYIKASIRGFS